MKHLDKFGTDTEKIKGIVRSMKNYGVRKPLKVVFGFEYKMTPYEAKIQKEKMT
jgi:hypothetical protein